MDTYFGKLLKQYDKIYNETVYGKGRWLMKANIASFSIAIASLLVCYVFIGLMTSRIFNPTKFNQTIGIISIIAFGIFMIAWMATGVQIVLAKYRLITTEFLKTWLKATEQSPGCKIKKTENTYGVLSRDLSTRQDTVPGASDDTKTGCIKLLPQNAPPLLLSLRGIDGPAGRPTLTQYFRLIDDTNSSFAQIDSMPAISRNQFNHLPDTITVPQLRVELFPEWCDAECEDSDRWIFTVANPDTQDKLQTALDALNKAICKLLLAESLEEAIEQNFPFIGSWDPDCEDYVFDYPRSELIRILNSESTDSPYAKEVRRLVEEIETIATSDQLMIDADTPLKLETATVT